MSWVGGGQSWACVFFGHQRGPTIRATREFGVVTRYDICLRPGCGMEFRW